MQLLFSRVREVKLPQYSSEGAGALDLYIPSDVDWESKTLLPGTSVNIPSGLKLEIPEGYCGLIVNKSSYGIKDLHVGACLIDCDYRGEIHLNVVNVGRDVVTIYRDKKIVQMLILPYYKPNLIEIHESYHSTTERNNGGFGSTGLD